ncbi:MAG: hypothetical protein JOY81_14145 [Alphaproteobacteria bacterium]|nr:hypothetical protein [Alphaproteobacteria bacterium]
MAGLSLVRSLAVIAAALLTHSLRRAAVMAAGYAVTGAFGATGLAFLTQAASRALTQAVGEVHGALILGGAYLMLALTVLLALQMKRR